MNRDNETSQPTAIDAGQSKYVQLHLIRRDRRNVKLQRRVKGRKIDGHVRQRRPELPD